MLNWQLELQAVRELLLLLHTYDFHIFRICYSFVYWVLEFVSFSFHFQKVLSRYLYFGEPINEAVEAPRIHHQLMPNELKYDHGKYEVPGFKQTLIDGLKGLGHNVTFQEATAGFGALTAVGYVGDKLVPVFDPRRNGSAYMNIFSYPVGNTGEFCSVELGSEAGSLPLTF